LRHNTERMTLNLLPRAVAATIFAAGLLLSQTTGTTTAGRRFIQATGQGSVSITPDQVQIAVSVVTQAATAQDTSTQNAVATQNVITALQNTLGSGAQVKTISYSLTPNYSSNGSVVVGYTATNTVQATTGDLTVIGKAIDSAIGAGANRVQGLTFGLKNDQPARAQALQQAARNALADATALATGLGVRTGNVLVAQEGSTITPLLTTTAAAPGATTTPVVPGTLTVSATATVQVEIQ